MSDLPIENVQSYPRPPALEPVTHRLVVHLGGEVAAVTESGYRVLETHHAPTYYIPRSDILAELVPVNRRSMCEWKGLASYFDVVSGSSRAPTAAWAYDTPTERFRPIAGYVAFYAGLMDRCTVGDETVLPQPGDFYGGWVTSNLEGVPKGARGTEHW